MYQTQYADEMLININGKNMMFGFNMGGKHEFLLSVLILISKWSLWKTGNKFKYD